MKFKSVKIVLLLLITLLAFGLRVYRVGSNPAGFFCDEAAIGYNAWSLLEKGTDEYNQPWPFFFRSFGDYRNPLPIYLMIPSVASFGLNEFSVRFTSVLAGTLTVLIVFLLVEQLFGSSIGLLASFLLAISPWHIHYSRFGSEYIFFPFLFSLAFYFFTLGVKGKRFILWGSFFVFGASLYTYYPAWLVVPIFVFGLIIFYRRSLLKTKKSSLLALAIFLFCLLPLALGVAKGTALTRWSRVSTFKTFQDQGSSLVDSAQTMVKTYWAHFSFDFLFEKGDIDYPGHFINRFSVKGLGELYLFQLPLLLVGLVFLWLNRRQPATKALLLWLACYPLGSTLIGTDGGGPFAFRSIIGVVPLQIVSALSLGFLSKLTLKKKRLTYYLKLVLLTFLLIVSFSSLKTYLGYYHFDYPLYSSDFWGWQYGPREVMKYFLEFKSQYDDLFLMGSFNSPEIFIKFYDPGDSCQNRCQIGGLEKLNPERRQLYAVGTDRYQEISRQLHFTTKKVIVYPDGSPAFYLGEIKALGK